MKFNSDSSHYIVILFTYLVHLCSVEKLHKVELKWIEKVIKSYLSHGVWWPVVWGGQWDAEIGVVQTIGKRHDEERLRVAHKLVDVALAGHFLHDPFLVVVAQRPRQLVVVHRRSILLHAPASRHLEEQNICLNDD